MSKSICIAPCFAALLLVSSIGRTNIICHALVSSLTYRRSPSNSCSPLRRRTHALLPASVHSSTQLAAKPKRGNVVDSYQTVSVNCNCKNRLFRYKKKNGTKSNLIKCYVERIVYEDPDSVLEQQFDKFSELSESDHKWCCPKCGINFGRSSLIHGMPAIKLVGGKTRMTKK